MDASRKFLCIHCGQCAAYCPGLALDLFYQDNVPAAYEHGGSVVAPDDLGRYLLDRRSVRLFKTASVSQSDIASALDIVRYAPSGKNGQPVKWVIIRSHEKRAEVMDSFISWVRALSAGDSPMKKKFPHAAVLKLRESGVDMILRDAPHLAIAYTPDDTVMGHAAVTDGIIALTHLDIVFPSFGIGGFWAGFFTMGLLESASLREIVGIPEGHSVCYAYAFGYPLYKPKSFPKRKAADIKWK
jgi:nitroreductase